MITATCVVRRKTSQSRKSKDADKPKDDKKGEAGPLVKRSLFDNFAAVKPTSMALVARSDFDRDTLLYDTGANSFTCNDSKWFTELNDYERGTTTPSSEMEVLVVSIRFYLYRFILRYS